ncbi:hypothetical protein H0H93_005289 [Arthromyces matolae]|nr:hypothetical protein H0H93_005289 [Arthromyces matolae]
MLFFDPPDSRATTPSSVDSLPSPKPLEAVVSQNATNCIVINSATIDPALLRFAFDAYSQEGRLRFCVPSADDACTAPLFEDADEKVVHLNGGTFQIQISRLDEAHLGVMYDLTTPVSILKNVARHLAAISLANLRAVTCAPVVGGYTIYTLERTPFNYIPVSKSYGFTLSPHPSSGNIPTLEEWKNFSDATVIGLNNNDFQIGRARKYTAKAGLEKQVSFVKGDFMKLAEQFGENSFDAVYAIEATVHAPSFEGVYGEIYKILKPGGVFGVYEWCMTDTWDPSNAEHKRLAHAIELGNGIPEMRPLRLARQALQTVGFQVEHEEDLADRGDEIPWYYPLEGDISKAQTFWDYFTVWRMSWSGKLVTHNALRLFEAVGIVPKGTHSVGESLKVAGDALVEGGQTKLFTPMYLAVCRKPAN